MTPYCHHEPAQATKGEPFAQGQCWVCWLYLNHEGYQAQWDGKPVPAQFLTQQEPTPERPPCKHLGEPTGETRLCGDCPGTVELKIFACAVHGQCTPVTPLPGVACCLAGCREYVASEK